MAFETDLGREAAGTQVLDHFEIGLSMHFTRLKSSFYLSDKYPRIGPFNPRKKISPTWQAVFGDAARNRLVQKVLVEPHSSKYSRAWLKAHRPLQPDNIKRAASKRITSSLTIRDEVVLISLNGRGAVCITSLIRRTSYKTHAFLHHLALR